VWTGTGCRRVTKADGTPFGQACVDMTQVRNEPFAVNTAADSDQSKADGSFSIRYVRPGKYLLTVERLDVKDYIRWAAYYPGVVKLAAGTIEVTPGRRYPTCSSALAKCVSTRSCPTLLAQTEACCPWRSSAYRFDAPERDALAYHLTQTRNINGEFPAGYVPSGELLVQTYLRPDWPDLKTGKIPADIALADGETRDVYRNGLGNYP
jgi:hypothetical protein